jgi:small subunit ribosomal protein S9
MVVGKKLVVTSGKRKTAIARASIRLGKGRLKVNNVPIEFVTPEVSRIKILDPIRLSGDVCKDLDIDVNVKGGGFMGQAEAVRMAVARGIVKWSKQSTIKKRFLDYDRTMLSGDSRRKESKKFGGPRARTRKQKSYR